MENKKESKILIYGVIADVLRYIQNEKGKKDILPHWSKVKIIDLNNDNNKEEFITMFQNYQSFEIDGECENGKISFIIERTEEEKKEILERQNQDYKNLFLRLKRFYNKEKNNFENRKQIIEYCNIKKLNWILEELQEYL